jgi:hypothetical protein
MPGILSDDPNSGMPGFNILGMILGGRGYAANYFGQRDQAQMDEFKRGEREKFSTGLLASEGYKNAINNPYDRDAQFRGIWAPFYSNRGGDVNMGNQLLDNSMKAIYGREKSVFDEEIWKKNLNLSAESELMVDQTKRDRDAEGKRKAFEGIFAPSETGEPGLITQAKRNSAFDIAFPNQRGTNDVVPGPNGIMNYRPGVGTEGFREMVGTVQSGQNVISGLSNLDDMLKNSTGNKSAWDAEKAMLTTEVKKLESLGALDEGTTKFIDQMVPGYNDAWSLNPQAAGTGAMREKLRVVTERYKAKLAQVGDRYLIPVDQVPNRANAVKAPGSPTKPMPSGPALIPPSPQRAPASRDSRPKPAAIQPPGLLESPGGRQYDPKTGGRAGRYGG